MIEGENIVTFALTLPKFSKYLTTDMNGRSAVDDDRTLGSHYTVKCLAHLQMLQQI